MPVLVLLVVLMLGMTTAHAMTVHFVNPGHADETYWTDVSRAMQDAAADLGITLTIDYAERDLLGEVELLRKVVRRPPAERPDYLLLAGEKRVLARQLQLAESAGIPCFVAFNARQADERQILGRPRERFSRWLGSLTPHAESAGYLTAKSLIEAGHQAGLQDEHGRLHLLALAGDGVTDSSVRRNSGLQQALAEHPEVVLQQMVYAEWRRDKAHSQTAHLLRRYPQTTLVWAGSDQMALGAMAAASEAGRTVGHDMLFSGVNTSDEAMQAVVDGRLAALAGGHYLQGAWALVLLHDYHHGRDFAADEGLEMVRPMFSLFTPDQARRFLSEGQQVDYRQYSKVHQPAIARYDFSGAPGLEQRP